MQFDITELRKYRFLSLSAIDLFGTIIITTIIVLIFSRFGLIDFDITNVIIANFLAILIGTLVHKLFNIKTKLSE